MSKKKKIHRTEITKTLKKHKDLEIKLNPNILFPILIFILTFLVYFNSLKNGFVFDDLLFI